MPLKWSNIVWKSGKIAKNGCKSHEYLTVSINPPWKWWKIVGNWNESEIELLWRQMQKVANRWQRRQRPFPFVDNWQLILEGVCQWNALKWAQGSKNRGKRRNSLWNVSGFSWGEPEFDEDSWSGGISAGLGIPKFAFFTAQNGRGSLQIGYSSWKSLQNSSKFPKKSLNIPKNCWKSQKNPWESIEIPKKSLGIHWNP